MNDTPMNILALADWAGLNVGLIEASHTPAGVRLSVSARDMAVGKGRLTGCVVEELAVVVEGLSLPGAPSTTAMRVRVDRLRVRVSDDWVTQSLQSLPDLAQYGLVDLGVSFHKDKVTVRGGYRKGLVIHFTIDVGLSTDGSHIIAELQAFWLMNMVPMPKVLQHLVLDAMKKFFAAGPIRLEDYKFVIDLKALAPLPLELEVLTLEADGGALLLQCGAPPVPIAVAAPTGP